MFFGGGALIGGDQGHPLAVNNVSSGISNSSQKKKKKKKSFSLFLFFAITSNFFIFVSRVEREPFILLFLFFLYQMLLSLTWSMRDGSRNTIESLVSSERLYRSICQRMSFDYLWTIS